MKKKLLVAAAILTCLNTISFAQIPFSTRDSVDINKLNAQLAVHGDMWWVPSPYGPGVEFPKHSGKYIGFASAVWMSGYDAANQLHVSAQMYRQTGNDYWPGPLDAAGNLSYATSLNWAKIWKVTRADIQAFRAMTSHTTASTPAAILTWPASGNTYAAGNAGAALTIPAGIDLAPFVDLNGNGIYEPLSGEYPDVKGDQTLWYVFSDNGPSHNETNGAPLKVEVQMMAYGYNRGTAIDNVIYYEYKVKNRSANNYHDFRISQFADLDLGYYHDDFIGFDSARRLGIMYNGSCADGADAGFPVNSYGMGQPVVGVTIVEQPGDVCGSYTPAGCFDYFNNDNGIVGNPTTDTQYNNYMRAKLRNGSHFTNDFAGPGISSKGFGSGAPVNYVFTGDLADTTQWSELASGNPPGDRKFLLTSNDFSLSAGQTQKMVIALLVTDTGVAAGGGCLHPSFPHIRALADTAWRAYCNPPAPLSVENTAAGAGFAVSPNPAHDILHITMDEGDDTQLSVYNAVGQAMHVPITGSGNSREISIANFPVGIYYLLYRNGATQQAVRFEKL